MRPATRPQRAHADYLHERGAGFVFTCKQNQPRLFAALDALPWTRHRSRPPRRPRPRTGHHPHHPGAARTHRSTVPARQPGLADRTLRHHPRRHPNLRGRRARRDQPDRPDRQPRTPRRAGPQPLGHRVTALAARHRLPRRPLHRAHQIRTPRHGRPAQPRRRRPPPRRPTRHHRSQPRSQPVMHRPFKILKLA